MGCDPIAGDFVMECIDTQQLKGLLAGWKNELKSFEDNGQDDMSSTMKHCISGIELILSIHKKNKVNYETKEFS